MTVESTNSTISYTGNNSVTTFAYNFLSYSEDHLFVYFDDVQQFIGFTITGIGVDTGGDIIFDVAPGAGVDIRIDRTVPETQLIEYQEYGPFPAKTNERGLDLSVMGNQQIQRDVARNSSRKMDKQPIATEDNIIIFDDEGNSKDSGFAISDIDGFTPIEQPRQAGDNAQTQFNTPADVAASPFEFQVRVDGLRSRGETDYTTNTVGKVDFIVAPSNLSEIDITWYKPLLGVDSVSIIKDLSQAYDLENIADMRASIIDFPLGKKLTTKGYYTSGGGGESNYIVVAGATGIDDGGKYIDLDNGLQAKLSPVGIPYIMQFGATGDGVTDDRPFIQAALSAYKVVKVDVEGVIFKVSGNTAISLQENQKLISDGSARISIFGTWDKPAFEAVDVGAVEIRGIDFSGSSHTSIDAVVKFTHTGSMVTGIIKAPILRNLSFRNFDSYAVLQVWNEVITNSDWTQKNEPPTDWATWNDLTVENITFKDNTVPVATKAQPSLAIASVRNVQVNHVTVINDEERGISIGYCTDVEVGDCQVRTISNANAGTNSHCVYMRTMKRFTISNMQLVLDVGSVNCFALRLSRGVYYGAISNVNAVALGTQNAGGFGSFGGNDITITGCTFRTPVNACVISGHASVNGVDGYSDPSFADCTNITVSDSIFDCFLPAGYALYMNAVAVANSEPIQPQYTDIKLDNCKFINSAVNCVQVGRIAVGNDAKMTNCTIIAENSEAGMVIARDARIPDDEFGWSFANNTFKTKTRVTVANPSATFGVTYTTVAILYNGLSSTLTNSTVDNNKFENWYTTIGNESGQLLAVTDNDIFNCLIGYRLDAATPYVNISNNYINADLPNGAAISLYGDTSKGVISKNIFNTNTASGIRFSTTNTIQGLQISYNLYKGASKFLRDTPDTATISVTHSNVDETVASDQPASTVFAFNHGFL